MEVIIESANRIELEVVRKVDGDSNHRHGVICHNLMPTDREVHKKEAPEHKTSDEYRSRLGLSPRRATWPRMKTSPGLHS